MRAAYIGLNMLLFSHSAAVKLQGSLGVMPLLLSYKAPWVLCLCCGNKVAWPFKSEGNSTNSRSTSSLNNDETFHEHVTHFRVKMVVQTLHPMITKYKITFGMNMCD